MKQYREHDALSLDVGKLARGPKLIAVNHSAELGGAEIGFYNMVRRFKDDIVPVVLEDGPLSDRLRDGGHQPIVLPEINRAVHGPLVKGRLGPARASSLLSASAQLGDNLAELMRSTGSQTVLFNSSRAIFMSAFIRSSRLPRNRIVMIRDSPSPPYLSRIRSVAARFAINRVASTVVANSPWTAQQVGQARSLRVIAPFLDERFFCEPLTPVSTHREKRILLLGRIAPWKGQLLGLTSLGEIDPSLVSKVTVAGAPWFGEEAYLHQLHAKAESMPNHNVTFLGHVDDVVELIDQHDIAIHTSIIPEPFGQVVVQAMARGRVIVAASDGGPRDIVTHLHDGYLYRRADGQSLTRCLRSAICADRGLDQMGALAVQNSRRFHPAVSESQLRGVLSEFINSG